MGGGCGALTAGDSKDKSAFKAIPAMHSGEVLNERGVLQAPI